MENLAGTNLAAGIVPFTEADTFPTHSAEYGRGGWRSVPTIEDRAAIPAARAEVGMVVYVVEDSIAYVYIGGEMNDENSWRELSNDIGAVKQTNVLSYKGEKASYTELNSITDMLCGDVWKVGTAEYLYTGTKWEQLGTPVDLSGYVQNADLTEVDNAEIDALFA